MSVTLARPNRSTGRRVLITHADEPLGRRLVKRLYHDVDVDSVIATGEGPPPGSFDHFLSASSERISYARVDLTRHRPTVDLFHSALVRERRVDTVIYLPRHSRSSFGNSPALSGLCERTAEARLVLQACLEAETVENLVALGSAFVYRLDPGNANLLDEASDLDLDPEVVPEIRGWIDSDMLLHGELHNRGLRIALLRSPTVIGAGGQAYLNPCLGQAHSWRPRPWGFDPLCALISEKDVARAIRLALHSRRAGVWNIAGRESIPLSTLERWSHRSSLAAPGMLLMAASQIAHAFRARGLETILSGPHLRYGFSLDISRATSDLGYEPGYRIDLARQADGDLQLESAPI